MWVECASDNTKVKVWLVCVLVLWDNKALPKLLNIRGMVISSYKNKKANELSGKREIPK